MGPVVKASAARRRARGSPANPAAPAAAAGKITVRLRDVWSPPSRLLPVAFALISVTLSGCGSGDSTVAKTPQNTSSSSPPSITAPTGPITPTGEAAPPGPVDPCAVNLASPTIAKVVSDLPRDPRSQQGWSPEPLAGNYNQCAQLSAVIVKANTNAVNPTTRAVMFHLGQFIPQGVPDTYGFNGIDASQTTGDTVALTYPSGISGLSTTVRFHWNGNGVELIGNTTH
jgi:LppP/LprE lipoprotein